MSDHHPRSAAPQAIRLACFGDSLMWGQGLRPEEKFARRLWDALQPTENAAAMPRPAADQLMMRAHAGAEIGATPQRASGGTSWWSGLLRAGFGPRAVPAWLAPHLAGEIAAAPPTVLQQIAAFDGDPALVDLVLVNGGGNDIGVFWYMNPATSLAALQQRIEQVCCHDLGRVLLHVAEQFPNACIVVPGYMQSLSAATEKGLAAGSGGALVRLIGRLGRPLLDRVFERNVFFREETARQLRRAVQTANPAGPHDTDEAARLAAMNERLMFADVDHFSQENAANGNHAWVWGIDTSSCSPQDALREFRRGACARFGHWSTPYWASVGHPNALGAQEIADAILRRLFAWSRHTTAPAADRLRAAILRGVQRRGLADAVNPAQ